MAGAQTASSPSATQRIDVQRLKGVIEGQGFCLGAAPLKVGQLVKMAHAS